MSYMLGIGLVDIDTDEWAEGYSPISHVQGTTIKFLTDTHRIVLEEEIGTSWPEHEYNTLGKMYKISSDDSEKCGDILVVPLELIE